tara:strand:- start:401 stop:556 length:156 start_codon:yes stop_codon:yes gene_type:complete
MAQASNKSSRQINKSYASSKDELKKQKQRKKHIKALTEFFKPKSQQFKKHG